MATKKKVPAPKKAPAKKPAARKRTPAPASPTPTTGSTSSVTLSASRTAQVLAQLKARAVPLTDADRHAFDELFTDTERDTLGGQTQSQNVVNLALAWLPQIFGTLASYPGAVAGFGPKRCAYAVELTQQLVSQRAADAAAASGKQSKSSSQVTAYGDGLSVVKQVVAKMEPVAGNATPEATALANTTGSLVHTLTSTTQADVLIDVLNGLADLIDTWSASGKATLLNRMADASLGAADAQRLRDAASTLSGAGAARTMAGRLRTTDSPAVNRLEGAVLLELKAAYNVTKAAHEANSLIPSLALMRGTDRVFRGNGHKAAATTAQAPATPAAVAPAPANAPPAKA